MAKGKKSVVIRDADAQSAAAAPSKPSFISTLKAPSSLWDQKINARGRGALAALGRMKVRNQGKMWSATFKKGGSASDDVDAAAAADLPPGSNSVILRFPVERTLIELQQQVGKSFGWKHAAVLYQLDHHQWEIPITSEAQMANAFTEWELTSGPRTRFKYDALFTEVEGYLGEVDDPAAMLRGAGAAWELACRATHHELFGEGFIDAIQTVLATGHFAPVCHAAAAIHMMLLVPETAQRFSPRVAEEFEKAVRVAFNPPDAATLGEVCRGSPSFLARQTVTALHRMLDGALPNHRIHASLLASAHAELALWRALLRVGPRRRGGDTPAAWAERTAAAHISASHAAVSRVVNRTRLLASRRGGGGGGGGGEPNDAAVDTLAITAAALAAAPVAAAAPSPASAEEMAAMEATAALSAAAAYAGEERPLRLALLEALNALVAAQPTACAARLAAAGALPFLSEWLSASLEDYLTEGAGGAPDDVAAQARAAGHPTAASYARAAADSGDGDDDDAAPPPAARKRRGSGAGAPAPTRAAAAATAASSAASAASARQRSVSGAPEALLLLSLTSTILRLRSGREKVEPPTALALLNTCALAALPLQAALEARNAAAADGDGVAEEAPTPHHDGTPAARAAAAYGAKDEARRGELPLMLQMLMATMWGASAALSQATAAQQEERPAAAVAAQPPLDDHKHVDSLLLRLLAGGADAEARPRLRPAPLGLAANMIAADPSYELPPGVAPHLLELITAFAAPAARVLRGVDPFANITWANQGIEEPSYFSLRRLDAAASSLAALLLRNVHSEREHRDMLLPIPAVRTVLLAILRLVLPAAEAAGAAPHASSATAAAVQPPPARVRTRPRRPRRAAAARRPSRN